MIGIGNADFRSMEFLDSDKKLLRNKTTTAVRDIVQFVKYNDYNVTDAIDIVNLGVS